MEMAVVNFERRFSESRVSLCTSLMASMRVLGPIFVRLLFVAGSDECRNCFCEHILWWGSASNGAAGERIPSDKVLPTL